MAVWTTGRCAFTNETEVVVTGAATPRLLVQAYDGGTPATQLQAAIRVDPVTGVTTATFLTPQSGYLVGGAAVQPTYGQVVNAAPSAIILGTVHGFTTSSLLVQVYETTGQQSTAGIQVHATTYDVTITTLTPQTLRVVIGSAVPLGPVVNGAVPLATTGVPPTMILPASTHGLPTPNLLIQLRDPNGDAVQGTVLVDPTTFAITAIFLTPQSGTLVFGGGVAVAPPVPISVCSSLPLTAYALPPVLRDMLVTPIQHATYVSQDAYGLPTYASLHTHPVKLQYRPQKVVDATGIERISRARLFLDGTVRLGLKDKLVLPDGTSPPVLTLYQVMDVSGAAHHWECDV